MKRAISQAIIMLLVTSGGGIASGDPVTAQEFELPGASPVREPDPSVPSEIPSYSLFSIQHRWFHSDVSMHESTIRASLPGIYNDGKTILIGGFRYGRLATSRHVQLGSVQPRRLHSFGFEGILVQGITEDTLLSVVLSIGYGSDWSWWRTAALHTTGAAFLEHNFTSDLRVGLGVAYTARGVSAIPLPLLRLVWRASERLELDFFVPEYLRLTYIISPRLFLDFTARVSESRYRTSSDAFPQPPDDLGTRESSYSVAHSVVDAGPSVRIGLWDHWYATIGASVLLDHAWHISPPTTVHVGVDQAPSSRVVHDSNRTSLTKNGPAWLLDLALGITL